jgi:hypothetical protein
MEVLRGKVTREQRGLRGGVTDFGFSALTISGMTGTMEVLRGKVTREQRGLRGGVTDLGFSVDWIGLDGRQARLLAFRSGGEKGCAFGMGRGRSQRVEPRTIRRGEDERKKRSPQSIFKNSCIILAKFKVLQALQKDKKPHIEWVNQQIF